MGNYDGHKSYRIAQVCSAVRLGDVARLRDFIFNGHEFWEKDAAGKTPYEYSKERSNGSKNVLEAAAEVLGVVLDTTEESTSEEI